MPPPPPGLASEDPGNYSRELFGEKVVRSFKGCRDFKGYQDSKGHQELEVCRYFE